MQPVSLYLGFSTQGYSRNIKSVVAFPDLYVCMKEVLLYVSKNEILLTFFKEPSAVYETISTLPCTLQEIMKFHHIHCF